MTRQDRPSGYGRISMAAINSASCWYSAGERLASFSTSLIATSRQSYQLPPGPGIGCCAIAGVANKAKAVAAMTSHFLRIGLIDAVKVDKDADGNVKAVYITYRELLSGDMVFAFFVDKGTCEIGRKWFADQGWIAGDPNDLK